MKRVSRSRGNLFTRYDPHRKAVAEVDEGETFQVETGHHLYLWKRTLRAGDTIEAVPMELMNALTGPIAVRGAKPGDVIALKILDIQCERTGDAATVPGTGLLRSKLKRPNMAIVRNDGSNILLTDDIRFPLKPMIGCIGTTPPEPVIALMPGPHGGNLDDPNVTIGTTVYLPVFVNGAKFALGDVHAAQADGEAVSPIDIGAVVTLRLEKLIRGRRIPEPRLETEDRWVIDKEADTMEEAAEKAAVAMAEFLKERLELSDHMIGIILSSVGGFRISQGGAYNYPVIVRAEVPKCIDRKGRLYGWP